MLQQNILSHLTPAPVLKSCICPEAKENRCHRALVFSTFENAARPSWLSSQGFGDSRHLLRVDRLGGMCLQTHCGIMTQSTAAKYFLLPRTLASHSVVDFVECRKCQATVRCGNILQQVLHERCSPSRLQTRARAFGAMSCFSSRILLLLLCSWISSGQA